MSDTVQEVEESLTDEFGRYVKPPKDGTIVWKICDKYCLFNENSRLADRFMVVGSSHSDSSVYVVQIGNGRPVVSVAHLGDAWIANRIYATAKDVYRELERECARRLQIIRTVSDMSTDGQYETHPIFA